MKFFKRYRSIEEDLKKVSKELDEVKTQLFNLSRSKTVSIEREYKVAKAPDFYLKTKDIAKKLGVETHDVTVAIKFCKLTNKIERHSASPQSTYFFRVEETNRAFERAKNLVGESNVKDFLIAYVEEIEKPSA